MSDAQAPELYDGSSDLTLEWAVVVTENKAYWYINGELAATFNTVALQFFNVGALCMNAVIYDVEVTVKSENSTKYAQLLSEYGVN